MALGLVIYSLFVVCGVAYEIARRRVSLTAACFTSVAFVRLVLIAHATFPAIPWEPVLLGLGITGLLSAAFAGFGMLQQQRRIYLGADVGMAALNAELSVAFLVACTAFGSESENGFVVPDSDWLSAALKLMGIVIIVPVTFWSILAAKRIRRSKQQT